MAKETLARIVSWVIIVTPVISGLVAISLSKSRDSPSKLLGIGGALILMGLILFIFEDKKNLGLEKDIPINLGLLKKIGIALFGVWILNAFVNSTLDVVGLSRAASADPAFRLIFATLFFIFLGAQILIERGK